ncbi:uncharacterized protein LOC132200975 [Neocloeon triangulifer]|uniref:uncharacterized protein LOC132200975 n=1 Tax=Neocloeon triangulifer TaxID=2078957 RepID=UPI00286F4FB9|nr:uncharacterized protein LOC132200975 [Neocloeon triangulifer]
MKPWIQIVLTSLALALVPPALFQEVIPDPAVASTEGVQNMAQNWDMGGGEVTYPQQPSPTNFYPGGEGEITPQDYPQVPDGENPFLTEQPDYGPEVNGRTRSSTSTTPWNGKSTLKSIYSNNRRTDRRKYGGSDTRQPNVGGNRRSNSQQSSNNGALSALKFDAKWNRIGIGKNGD